ncbi:Serine/threonine-protein kinase [Podospora fimiseda]|uniref:non-specific serine/threonine protein kinase n=1 Tax=Podospora fimiseda TaxID=252190 RepID=A0AAN7BMQ0_9PEZI|nr:Serine/threonine-protein kinase [Podospora fimiseda]
MAQIFYDLFSSFGSCLNCFPGSPTLKINSRSFKILRLLGEGGFSYVYLVQDISSPSELYALKKIRCPFGAESVAQAMKEVEAYKLFEYSKHIIHSIDYMIANERGGDDEGKTVYVLLPYYRRGNLQDMINANLVNGTKMPERKLMGLFRGVLEGVRDMHKYKGGGGGGERMVMGGEEGNMKKKRGVNGGADDEEEEEQGRSLLTEDERSRGVRETGGKERSYAHRDIKPGNIMITDSGDEPILMDLGSVAVSPIPITNRSLAIATQDIAAEHSTMPYRAPELFDVKTGTVIDTKVDIWSLGCTLYACLVGKSPFEMRSDETGGSLSICVLSGDWRFPDEGQGAAPKGKQPVGGAAAPAAQEISEPIRDVVRKCLAVEPSERPDIDELIELVDRVLEVLPEDSV